MKCNQNPTVRRRWSCIKIFTQTNLKFISTKARWVSAAVREEGYFPETYGTINIPDQLHPAVAVVKTQLIIYKLQVGHAFGLRRRRRDTPFARLPQSRNDDIVGKSSWQP